MRALSLVLVLLVVAGFAGPASATHYNSFVYNADCEGWNVYGSFYFATAETVANMTYFVRLHQGYTLIAEFVGTHDVYKADPTFNFSDVWGVELCGTYHVSGSFHYEAMYGSGTQNFQFDITCECTPPDTVCTYTPGYWRNHPEDWPVSALTVGGVDYTKAELLEILGEPTVGDITIILFHHLLAAKLNVLIGADGYIQSYIDMGDAYLIEYPLYSKPKGEAKDEGVAIKDELLDYNEIGCAGAVSTSVEAFKIEAKSPSLLGEQPAAPKTWGSIKKLNEE